jgi:hypothetical protein
MELDFMERQELRNSARNSAFEQAACLLDEAAIRLLGGRARVPQADRHTAEVLREKAVLIRSMKRSESPSEDSPR